MFTVSIDYTHRGGEGAGPSKMVSGTPVKGEQNKESDRRGRGLGAVPSTEGLDLRWKWGVPIMFFMVCDIFRFHGDPGMGDVSMVEAAMVAAAMAASGPA